MKPPGGATPDVHVHHGLLAPWRLVPGLLFALIAIPTLAGQIADPKTDFIDALGRFSLGLEGTYGDEGKVIWASLDAMERGLKQWDATIRTYEAAMASQISGAEPRLAARMHSALGGVYLDRSRVTDALREFAAAGQLDPDRADVFTLLGLAYNHPLANDPSAATRAFRRASALDPHDPVRAYMLARQLMKVGELEEARKALRVFEENRKLQTADQRRTAVVSPFVRPGLQESPGIETFFPPALYAGGFALLQRGDYNRAIAELREEAARDPLAADPVEKMAAMGKAAAAFRDGSVATAVQHLKVAIELTPDRAEPHRILGLVYLADEQYDNAVDEVTDAVRLSPGDERAHLALANAFMETGRYPEAEQALRETIRAFPASGRARYTLGRVYQRQARQREALSEFEEALTFKPLLGLNSLDQTMGALNVRQQNFDGAIEAYSRRIDVIPNDADAHQELGETYFRQGSDDEAQAEFEVVLMLKPDHPAAHAALAQLHLRAGRYADALEASRRTLELDPTHKQARYTLATSLMRLGRTEEGKEELQVFERLQGDATAAQARDLELGALKREASASSANGDHGKAVSLLRRALALKPDEAVSHLNLGLALLRAGQPAEAIVHFTSAVGLDAPVEVHKYLAEAYAAIGQIDESRRERALYEAARQENLRNRSSK
jgi:tetratricopeptide (TPR) repeat protein